jgi:hypothetical protein
MTLKPLGPNRNVLSIGKAEVLFSYKTPVAAFVPGRGYVATDYKYSTTTSRHVNQWADCKRIPNVEFLNLLQELGVD